MLATVALGYADGIMRAASNRGFAALGNARAPYAGRVSMDLLTLDVTDSTEAPSMGDVAELFGDTITLTEAATYCATNEYEMLTGLSPRIPRHYTDET
jgi:alanine racemase